MCSLENAFAEPPTAGRALAGLLWRGQRRTCLDAALFPLPPEGGLWRAQACVRKWSPLTAGAAYELEVNAQCACYLAVWDAWLLSTRGPSAAHALRSLSSLPEEESFAPASPPLLSPADLKSLAGPGPCCGHAPMRSSVSLAGWQLSSYELTYKWTNTVHS